MQDIKDMTKEPHKKTQMIPISSMTYEDFSKMPHSNDTLQAVIDTMRQNSQDQINSLFVAMEQMSKHIGIISQAIERIDQVLSGNEKYKQLGLMDSMEKLANQQKKHEIWMITVTSGAIVFIFLFRDSLSRILGIK